MSDRHPTARRLIEQGLRLFVEQGVGATPIVQIERAAGLAPGSGAFYKHFRSKDQLVGAALDDALASASAGVELFDSLRSLDLRDQATLVVRGAWLVLDTHRDLILVMAREPRYRPDTFGIDPERWPVTGPSFVTRWLTGLQSGGVIALDDPEATALVLTDALTAYWRQQQTHPETPYGVGPDRFIEAWVDLVLANASPTTAPPPAS